VKEQLRSQTMHGPVPNSELDRLSGLALAAAKDFNDELTFILNHAEASLDLVGPRHPACGSLMELQHAVMRCAEITRCLSLLTLRAGGPVHYGTVRTGDEDSGD
jgi:hypothetical protein